MKTSPEVDKISAAFAKAQSEVKGAIKDSQNPHLKNKYADLASTFDACRDALSKNGLAVIQDPGSPGQNYVSVTTRVIHSSGQWFEADGLMMPLEKPSAQAVGSAITYARRYSLAAMMGICPEDDDGEAAVGRGPAPSAKPAVDWDSRAEEAKVTIGKARNKADLDALSPKIAGAFPKGVAPDHVRDDVSKYFAEARKVLG
jgi:hypothetical protein